MKKLPVSFFIILLFCSVGISQDTELKLKYFPATADWEHGNLSEYEVTIIVREMGENYIWAKKVLDPRTLKKSKAGLAAWALSYQNEPYFNMRFLKDVSALNYYVKLDVTGHYCLAILDMQAFAAFEKARPNNYGGGLTGVLINDAATWTGAWLDKDGNKKKIIFINRNNKTITSVNKARNSPGYLLSRSILKDLLGDNITDKKIEDYTVEEIVEIVKARN